jgi:hypothetical protein
MVYVLIAAVFAWNSAGLIGGAIIKRGEKLRLNRHQTRWLTGFVSVVFLINWAYRLSMGLK